MSRTLSHTHSIDRTSTHRCIWHKHCTSLCAWNFLSALSYIYWSASSFDKQVDSVKEHLTRTQTDAHAVTVCLWPGYSTSKMLLWLGLNKSCHHSTATSLAQTQLHNAGSPEKALNFFFFCFWISHFNTNTGRTKTISTTFRPEASLGNKDNFHNVSPGGFIR